MRNNVFTTRSLTARFTMLILWHIVYRKLAWCLDAATARDCVIADAYTGSFYEFIAG